MMITIRELYNEGRDLLENAGIPDASIDARYLLEYVADMDSSSFFLNGSMEAKDCVVHKYIEDIKIRCTHYPLQYIIGYQEFMGIRINVTSDVLIPRQDTEILIEKVLETGIKDKNILDMCTGSGCIAISLDMLGHPKSTTGVDISDKALNVARHNSIMNNTEITWLHSDLFCNVEGRFDIIVSNPPYIATSEIDTLMEEVRCFEPRLALDGESDGLYFYRRIIEQAGDYLEPGGMLCFEIGCEQADSVYNILKENNYINIKVIKDLAGLNRVVMANIK